MIVFAATCNRQNYFGKYLKDFIHIYMINNRSQIVAIVDSGIGGVSILKQLIKKYKSGNFIYFADNLNMPYGNKSKKWLTNRMDEIIYTLKRKYHADQIIIACNTASSCIGKNQYNNVIPMEFDKTLTYFATNLTKQNMKDLNVVADKTLAQQIENNIFNEKNLDIIIKEHVFINNLNKINKFVLGCTHYELVKPIFEKHCPNSFVINNSSLIINSIKIEEGFGYNISIVLTKKDLDFENKILKLLKI